VNEVIAEIISTGDEVLGGRITDTNAAYLSRSLMEMGITPAYRTTVGDDRQRYEEVLRKALSRAQVVITIGGLGPSDDDLTREVCAKVLERKLRHNPEVEERIRSILKIHEIPCGDAQLSQAFFPEGSGLIPNHEGTDFGFAVMEKDLFLASLAGEPLELEYMMELYLFPYLRETFPELRRIPLMKASFFGISESALQQAVEPVFKKFPNVKWGITTCQMVLTLCFICPPGKSEQFSPLLNEIDGAAGKYMFGIGDSTLPEVVVDLLKTSGLKIAIAESCTGGLISHILTEEPGISASLLESVVAYSDESKMRRLGVKKETLEKYGAVSEEVAIEMAQGIREQSGADIGVGVTGIAGPKGGTKEKPVGLVCSSIIHEDNQHNFALNFSGTRSDVKMRATNMILNLVRIILESKDKGR